MAIVPIHKSALYISLVNITFLSKQAQPARASLSDNLAVENGKTLEDTVPADPFVSDRKSSYTDFGPKARLVTSNRGSI